MKTSCRYTSADSYLMVGSVMSIVHWNAFGFHFRPNCIRDLLYTLWYIVHVPLHLFLSSVLIFQYAELQSSIKSMHALSKTSRCPSTIGTGSTLLVVKAFRLRYSIQSLSVTFSSEYNKIDDGSSDCAGSITFMPIILWLSAFLNSPYLCLIRYWARLIVRTSNLVISMLFLALLMRPNICIPNFLKFGKGAQKFLTVFSVLGPHCWSCLPRLGLKHYRRRSQLLFIWPSDHLVTPFFVLYGCNVVCNRLILFSLFWQDDCKSFQVINALRQVCPDSIKLSFWQSRQFLRNICSANWNLQVLQGINNPWGW